MALIPADKAAQMTRGDLVMLLPWLVFGIAVGFIAFRLFRRRGPR
jgi:hypothetical protein